MQQSGIVGISVQGLDEKVSDFRDSPFCSPEVFAQMLDVSQDVVRGWIESNTVPNCKIGRRRVINLHRIRRDLDRGKSVFCTGDYSDE
ncbi:hypothetical protein LX59_01585 [Azomonas agilis]|uniref:Excisionase family DNA binding protein n=1 Tax=Azomonas agilis TaxID=116849 RepID=A0A562IKA5_9GAMM|nr:helix-turn-helix domain-containing protein [Azomonas agilis]TWH71302.1 hypothetical protein LX59_01585 [Azomonas agilis]